MPTGIGVRQVRISSSMPKRSGRGMPAMPAAPPKTVSQFSSTILVIEAKPRVTIAR